MIRAKQLRLFLLLTICACTDKKVPLISEIDPITKLTKYDNFGEVVEEMICNDKGQIIEYYLIKEDTIIKSVFYKVDNIIKEINSNEEAFYRIRLFSTKKIKDNIVLSEYIHPENFSNNCSCKNICK